MIIRWCMGVTASKIMDQCWQSESPRSVTVKALSSIGLVVGEAIPRASALDRYDLGTGEERSPAKLPQARPTMSGRART